MSGMKSIRFPPPVADEMVRAILDGRKTVTRRVVNFMFPEDVDSFQIERYAKDDSLSGLLVYENGKPSRVYEVPYRPGDTLYVRETWRIWRAHRYNADAHIEFKAGGEGCVIRFPHGCTDSVNRDDYDRFISKWGVGENKWKPSIHMPKEAARLFLRVTDVRVERLQEITEEQATKEGVYCSREDYGIAIYTFSDIWDSTIKKATDRVYGWEANPWVWVIEFERCGKPKEDTPC